MKLNAANLCLWGVLGAVLCAGTTSHAQRSAAVNPATASSVQATAGGAEIKYVLPRAGRVSLAVYDAGGRMVRTLASALPQEAGTNSIVWDGLDSEGKPAPAGEYSWKLLLSQGMKAEYLMALGTSVGINHWPAQHGGPNTVAVEGDSFIVGGNPEGSPTFAKARFDGTYEYPVGVFQNEPGVGPVTGAIDNGTYYTLMQSGRLWALNSADGKIKRNGIPLFLPLRSLGAASGETKKWMSFDVSPGRYMVNFKVGQEGAPSGKASVYVQDQWWELPPTVAGKYTDVLAPRVYDNYLPAGSWNGKLNVRIEGATSWAVADMQLLTPAEDIDARFNEVVASYPAAKTVAWIDPATGKLLDRVDNIQASRVALIAPGKLLAVSGSEAVLVSRDGTSEVKISGLVAPRAVAFDPRSGGLWVAEGGNSQQVKYFDRTFKLVKTLGRAGGREEGIYKPENFLHVAAISADGHGGFVISEDNSAPRRTARFDGEGKLLREWYGGQQYYTYAAPDPDNANVLWMDSQWGWLMQVRVDWDKKDWKVLACYRWGGDASPNLVGRYKMAMRHEVRRFDLNKDGVKETYIFGNNGALQLVDPKAGRLRAVSVQGELAGNAGWLESDPAQFPKPWKDALQLRGEPLKNFGYYRAFSWSDSNGDFDFQPEEFRLTRHDPLGYNILYLNEDLSIVRRANSAKAVRYKPQGFTPSGAPIWDWDKAEPQPLYSRGNLQSMLRDKDENMYLSIQGGGDGFISADTWGLGHGFIWPANQSDAAAVVKTDKAGNVLWKVGSLAFSRDNAPGQLHNPVHFAGRVNGTVGVCDKIVQPVVFWTEDGLYAGSLFDGRAENKLPKRLYAWGNGGTEDFHPETGFAALQYDWALGGTLVQRPNGEVVFIGSGFNNCPAYRVTGWNEFQRQSGKLLVKSPVTSVPGQSGTGLRAEYFVGQNLDGEPAVTDTASRIWFDPVKKPYGASILWPAAAAQKDAYSARWTGMLEPKFSEDYTLTMYGINGGAKLWLGGRLLVQASASWGAQDGTWRVNAPAVPLCAGRKYPLAIEFTGASGSGLHLNWSSSSQPIEHIPPGSLYGPDARQLPVVSLRASTPRALRPPKGGKPRAAAEWILTRSVVLDKPLDVELQWLGTGKAGKDYALLPRRAHFGAGQAEVRLPLMATPGAGVAEASVEVAGQVGVAADYLLDGTTGSAMLFLSDPGRRRIEGVKVTAVYEGGQMVAWAAPNIHTDTVNNLVNGSGLDRTVDPPMHDTELKNAWYASDIDVDKASLLFDLGALHDLGDINVWNLNTTEGHGRGWGQADSVRPSVPRIKILLAASPEGPWTDLGVTPLRSASGKAPDPGQLIPIGKRARYVRFVFSKPTAAITIGLAEVEFYGKAVTP